MAACRLSSSPKKPVWGMPHTGLNNPPAQGNILKPDSPNDWRELGSQVTAYGFSQRRACRLIEADPKTVWTNAERDAPEVRQQLRELAAESAGSSATGVSAS